MAKKLADYDEWEYDFPEIYRCCDILDSECGGQWEEYEEDCRPDFRCTRCGRELDTKTRAEIRGGKLSLYISQVPWDSHYKAGTIIAARAKDGCEYAFYKGDGRIVHASKPSPRGTKKYGSTPYYRIEVSVFQRLYSGGQLHLFDDG